MKIDYVHIPSDSSNYYMTEDLVVFEYHYLLKRGATLKHMVILEHSRSSYVYIVIFHSDMLII